MKKKVKKLATQLCPILCDPVDCSPPGSSIHGILQARILEWVAIFFSSKLTCVLSRLKVKVKSLSRVQLFATPGTIAGQALLCKEFSRQECWSGLPFPSPGDLPHPGIEPRSPALQTDSLPSEPPGKPVVVVVVVSSSVSHSVMTDSL